MHPESTINTISSRHCPLNMKCPDILPSFFRQTNQEIYGLGYILNDLCVCHAFLSNGNTQIDTLFKLELDGLLQ